LFLLFRARGKTDPRPNVSLAEFLFPPLGDRGKTDPRPNVSLAEFLFPPFRGQG